MFAGYGEDPADILDTIFEEVEGYDEMVLVRDIPFVSHCEHHMAPFFGKAHIAYYPDGGVVGLSKLARLVELYARRLQTQEAMTAQILRALDDRLTPRGAAVLIEAEHMCMSMRGVRKPGAMTTTLLLLRPAPRRPCGAGALFRSGARPMSATISQAAGLRTLAGLLHGVPAGPAALVWG